MEKKNSKFSVKFIVLMGMFCALAYVVTVLSKLIPISVAGFLSLDFKDIIVAICGFMIGPIPAVIVSVIASLIEMVTISSTGIIGFIMNVLQTCAFVIPATLMYRARRKFSGAIIGLIIGVVSQTAVMILWNWLITPLYMGVDRSVVVAMLVPTFLPFNLIKGAMNAAGTMLLYKPIITALRKARLVEKSNNSGENTPKTGMTVGVTLISLVALATLVLIILVWTGII